MCGRHEIGDSRPEFMNNALLWRLMNDIAVHRSEVSTIVPFLNGEPLEDERIFNVIDFIAEEVGPRKVHFSTNASLLEGDKADRLLCCLAENKLQSLSFSVDGYDNFEKIRSGLSREQVYKNIGDFLGAIDDPVTRNMINIHFTAVQENLGDIENFVNYWGVCRDYRWTIMPADSRSDLLFGLPVDRSNVRLPNPIPCWQILWSNVYVMTDGTFVPCCVDCLGASKMGNLHENTIEEVFTSQRYEEFRTKHLQIKKNELSACQNCQTHY